MKKILIFDCWLPGFTYVQELANRTDSVDLEFVHTSSLQTGAPAREYQDFKTKYDVPPWVRDFSHYGYDFKRLFDEVLPDAVLVLSLQHLEARTFLKYAKHRGVPTYYIPHGIVLFRDAPPTSETSKGFGAKMRHLLSELPRVLSKLPRVAYYTGLFWRFNFAFRREGVVATRFLLSLGVYSELIGDYSRWQAWPGPKTQAYYASIIENVLLYDESLDRYYREHYGRIVDRATLVPSGTLDVAKLTSHLQSNPDLSLPSQRIAYLISSPYPEYFDEPQASICKDVVRKLRDLVLAAGYDRLVYRPHPGETAQFTQFICADFNIEVDTAGGVGGLLASELICGTSSSLLYIAVILKRKILILDSKRIKVDAPYYEPLISYPAVQFDADLERDDKALADLSAQSGQAGKPDIGELRDPLSDFIALLYEEHPARHSDAG